MTLTWTSNGLNVWTCLWGHTCRRDDCGSCSIIYLNILCLWTGLLKHMRRLWWLQYYYLNISSWWTCPCMHKRWLWWLWYQTFIFLFISLWKLTKLFPNFVIICYVTHCCISYGLIDWVYSRSDHLVYDFS